MQKDVITVFDQRSGSGRPSAMTIRRLVRTLDRLPAAEAAELLATRPAALAARALARMIPHHGMRTAGALGENRVKQLMAALPESSEARRRLRIWLIDCRRTGRLADLGERLHAR